jgi:hypothetical protein
MEQEDYIKRQIDQLGQVLGKLLAGMFGFKTAGMPGMGIRSAGEALKGELDLDIDALVSVPAGRLIPILEAVKGMNCDNLEKLADILLLLAEESGHNHAGNPLAKKLYAAALTIFAHVDETGTTYSFDRHRKISEIRDLIKISTDPEMPG